MIRYADDLVILSHSLVGAEAALAQLQDWLADRGLALHSEKTRIADLTQPGDGVDFLGYHFTHTRRTRWPRRKSLRKLKDNLRQKTRRFSGESMARIALQVNRILKGWFEYFKHSNKYTCLRLDQWLPRRLRSIRRKRCKRTGNSRGWDNQRWPITYFRELGLFSLVEAKQPFPSPREVNHQLESRMRETRTSGSVGGGAR